MRLRSGLLALLVCALAPCASAVAASPPGTLAQVAGVGGCVSQQAPLGCTAGRGLDDVRTVALAPDGKTLYAVAATPASLTTFSVDARNGLLQQLNLSAGCLVSINQADCGNVRALGGASGVVVSPDGLHVYVSAAAAGAVASFARQPNGSLVQLAGLAGCTSTTTVTPGCDTAPSLAGASAIAISPDGRFVYVAGGSADSLVVFSRDAATGRLQVLPGALGCLRANRTGCTPITGVDAPSAIAISPDGTSLYVTSTAGTLTAFQRDVTAGTLSQQPLGAGCFSDNPLGDCVAIGGLARASSVTVSPDGKSVIVVGTDDDAVLSFRREPTSGVLTRVSCVSGLTTTPGCTPTTLVHGPRAAIVRPDGLVVWVAASRADSIVTLQLDPATSALVPTAGAGGCLRRLASNDCRPARALDDPRGLAVTADGLHLYAAGTQSDGIAELGPQRAPNCLKVRAATVANTSHSVVLACSDPNGDKIELTIVKKPKHGTLGRLAATGSVVYQPLPGYAGPDSFTFTATDGMDVSAPGIATVNVKLPPRAPKVRIRTSTARLVQGERIHVLVECPAVAIGPCRVAARLLVNGRDAGNGSARLPRRTTGRVVVTVDGVAGRTRAVVVVTVRDKSRRATSSRRTIVITT
jgi:6-phosphogluconolactonase (cycloisomerase 2 family)